MIVPALLIAFILLTNNKKGLGALSVSKFYRVYIDEKIKPRFDEQEYQKLKEIGVELGIKLRD